MRPHQSNLVGMLEKGECSDHECGKECDESESKMTVERKTPKC